MGAKDEKYLPVKQSPELSMAAEPVTVSLTLPDMRPVRERSLKHE